MKLAHLLFLLSLVLVWCAGVKGEDVNRNKYINVAIKSNWGSTPIHLEASEFFASEGEDLFWKFLEAYHTTGDASNPTTTDEQKYNTSIKSAEAILVHDKVQLLKLSLSLRTYSPRIEMYRQLPQMESDTATVARVRLGESIITSPSDLENALSNLPAENASALFDFDHIYPTSHAHTHFAILYADFSDPIFLAFHSILSVAAKQGKIGYVFRHIVPSSNVPINLQGWGVDLAIKNVEYKAMDDSKVSKEKHESESGYSGVEEDEEIAGFRIGVLKKRKPELSQQLDDFNTFLMRKDVKVDDLNVWDFKDMGLQASQKVVSGSDPLRVLRDISQNFPSLAAPLTKLKQNITLKQEIQHNQNKVSEGENLVLLNGRVVEPENLDAFEFLAVLRDELTKVENLQSLKLTLPTLLPFLSTPLPEKVNLRFQIDDSSIVYANNMEKDDTYARWPRGVSDFMRRVYPGQMRFVARNFYTVVLVADFTEIPALDAASTLYGLLSQNLPARVAILPLVSPNNEASRSLAQVISFLGTRNGKSALSFLNLFGQHTRGFAHPLTAKDVENTYNNFAGHIGMQDVSYDEITTSEKAQELVESAIEFATGMGLDSQQLFINGFLSDANKEILDAISEAMTDQAPFLQSLIQQGRIHDGTNIYQLLMHPPEYLARSVNVVQRFSKYVAPSEANPLKVLKLVGNTQVGKSSVLDQLIFLEKNKDDVKKFSHILVVDVSKSVSVQLALEAIQFLETSTMSRVNLLFNPETDPSQVEASEFSTRFALEEAILKAGTNIGVVKALLVAQRDALKANSPLSVESIGKVVEESRNGKKLPKISGDLRERVIEGRWWANNFAKVAAGSPAIIVNGRLINIASSPFVSKDFEFLELFQDLRYGRSIDILLLDPKFVDVDPDDLTSSFLSTVAMRATSLLGLDEQNGIKRRTVSGDMKISAQQISSEDATLHITAVLNPLSKASQKFSPVLMTLRKLFAVDIKLILNPILQLSDLPLKRYYHYLFDSELEFEDGQLLPGGTATLSQLPLTRILTLGMDTPEAWLVQPVVARYDLDNIKLEDLGDEKVLTAVFELEHILVEGNCYDISTLQWGVPSPPRGLELVLQHNDPNLPSVDTLVMSNFGYFQLKANPGIWKLRLAEGRGKQIYSITKDTTNEKDEFRWVVVSSFLGETVLFKVERNPGMEGAQLLAPEEESSGNAWDALSGLWNGDKKAEDTTTTLHIFSVASGHLYERLLRIMMLSVVKQTKAPVKFWFLKNYLSPKFKEIIPHMAQQYNFTYELVTYKWPSWLRKQTEKQRIIWAYKILFLDVLFPLGVKKIIFVDADQVVRTDMMELYNMDLEGAPLAYTPFCNNKPEMDGFRFWKAGYWKDHLRGRPYHISALYVIDLQQFRRTAAGDQLRSTYDMLSRDPNSLANLDQDLPNYLQHAVKIHSLPQEWLWCETWCPEETKITAKTIDLCNNPLTKASKLENAVRILGDEWTSLDNEVKELEQKIVQNKSTQPTSTTTHPHASHTTHKDATTEKISEAYGKLQGKILQ